MPRRSLSHKPPRTESHLPTSEDGRREAADDPPPRPRRSRAQPPAGADREQVRLKQRERLQAAIAQLIVRRGYHAVRILDITRVARVSRPTFYSLYCDKDQLFLDAYDEIAGRTATSVMAAYNVEGSAAQRMRSGLREFAALAAAEPEPVSLLVLGAFGAGIKALERRDRMLEGLERRILATRDRAVGANGPLPTGRARPSGRDLIVKLIIGGIREVTSARLRQGRAAELPALADDLADWAGSYPMEIPAGLDDPTPAARRGPGSTLHLASERARRAQGRLPSGRHDLPQDLVKKSQRERIVDSTAAIVAEKGLAALTIPEIARRANVSHQTFYEIYPGKHEAFLGAQKIGMHQALLVTAEAYEAQEGDWPAAVAAGLQALLEYLASEPAHAHLSIVETFAASPEAIENRDSALHAFAAFLSPGYRAASAESVVSPVTPEAIAGGIWQVLHMYVADERVGELPAVAALITYMALTPFLGSREAARVAADRSPTAGAPL